MSTCSQKFEFAGFGAARREELPLHYAYEVSRRQGADLSQGSQKAGMHRTRQVEISVAFCFQGRTGNV